MEPKKMYAAARAYPVERPPHHPISASSALAALYGRAEKDAATTPFTRFWRAPTTNGGVVTAVGLLVLGDYVIAPVVLEVVRWMLR